jgi:copper chaperone CopZ
MKKITISLPTIHCESCIKLIGMTLKNITGISSRQFDLEQRKLYLETDSALSGEAIAKAIREDAEYEAILEIEEEEKPPEPPSNQEQTKTPEDLPIETIQPPIKAIQKEVNSSIAILSIE